MKQVPDNYFDLVLTDPPYGIGIDGQKKSVNVNNPKANRKHHDFKGWDNETPPKEYFDEIFRISKHQIIWGANYFVDKLQGTTKGWLVWDKGQRDLTMSDCELCFTSFQTATRIVTFNRVEIQKDGSRHPTQKPEKVIEFSLRYATEKEDIKTVFDPFFGSGTTGVVAKRLDLEWCACEKEADYVAIANKRLEAVQGSLF
jgi:site-specific DNA-methyltransferase (adenine-specific)